MIKKLLLVNLLSQQFPKILSMFTNKSSGTAKWLCVVVVFFFVNFSLGQIVQRGVATTGNTSSASLVIPKPAGIVAGDVMIVNIAQKGSKWFSGLSNPTSSSWTLVSGANLFEFIVFEHKVTLLYKVATASDAATTNYTFTLDDNTNKAIGTIVAFSGVDISGATPFDVAPGSISVQGDTSNGGATAITTASANAAVIMFTQAAGSSSPTWSNWNTTSPGVLTELYGNQNSGAASVGAAWAIKATPGSTGAGSVTLSAKERSGGILIALKRKVTTITDISPKTGCVGSTITITGTNLTGATAADVKIGGTPVSSITSITATQIVAVVGTGTTGKVTVANSLGTATSADTFTVNARPTVTNSTLTQTICSGGNSAAVTFTSGVVGTTFSWTATATAGVTEFTSSGIGNLPAQTISTTGTTQGTVTYVITPTANGCAGNAVNYTIVVNPRPTLTNSSLTQTICSGRSSTTVVLTSGVAGTTFSWTATATPGVTGFAASGTGNIPAQTIAKTGATQGTVTYVITPTVNGCAGTATNYTILVNPTPVAPKAGTITNSSCTVNTGSIELTDLPSGTWTITSSPATGNTTGSGSTTTISGLVAGVYTFTVTNADGCISTASDPITIEDNATTEWDGSDWSNGNPNATKSAIITSVTPNSPFTADLTACSLTINSGVIATVPSGITLTILNAVTTNGQLIFENSASLVQDPTSTINTNSGNIVYKRSSAPMKNFDFSYWSSPVSNQNLRNLSPNTLHDKYMSYTSTGWISENAATTSMAPGKGYIIRVPKPGGGYANGKDIWSGANYVQKVEFEGIPNNGNIDGEEVSTGNFYLIGNPYPSALNANEFLFKTPGNGGVNSNSDILNGTIYFWTHITPIQQSGSKYVYASADYASYNGTGGVATSDGVEPTGYIAAGQSFFGSAKAPGTIRFKNTMRVSGNNNQFFKPGKTSKGNALEKNRLWLNMTNAQGAFKQTLVGYVSGATNDFDNDFDGISFDGNSFIDFYSLSNTSKMVIQGRALPFQDNDLVPLGFRSTLAGEFTIGIGKADGLLADRQVYLEDKQSGMVHDLTVSDYTFTTAKGTFNDRFVLKYTNVTLGADGFETLPNEVLVTAQNKTVTVSSKTQNIQQIVIYDLGGQLLYQKDAVSDAAFITPVLNFAQQVLLVKVVLQNGGTVTEKIILK